MCKVFFRRGSKRPPGMLKFFSGGKVGGRGGKVGFQRRGLGGKFKGLGGKLTEFKHFPIFDLIELIFQV